MKFKLKVLTELQDGFSIIQITSMHYLVFKEKYLAAVIFLDKKTIIIKTDFENDFVALHKADPSLYFFTQAEFEGFTTMVMDTLPVKMDVETYKVNIRRPRFATLDKEG